MFCVYLYIYSADVSVLVPFSRHVDRNYSTGTRKPEYGKATTNIFTRGMSTDRLSRRPVGFGYFIVLITTDDTSVRKEEEKDREVVGEVEKF